jgi:hypothetical protein
MVTRTEATINSLVALFVVFVALLDPLISVALAVVFLVALSLFKFSHRAKDSLSP